MKPKITRKLVLVALIAIGILLTFLTCWLFSNSSPMFNDQISRYSDGDIRVSFGWVHIAINFLIVIVDIIWLFVFCFEAFEEKAKDRPFHKLYSNKETYSSDYETEKEPVKPIRWKRWVWIFVLIVLVLQIFKFSKVVYKQSVFVYNTSKKYHNTYQQKVEEKQGFYDKLWKTYLQKEKITNINKETFIQVTKLIMENRKDGEQLTWKWLQENQQIPYEEFTTFYADLSTFITKQREGYFNIEKACQTIANQNNTLLDTFPNNIYNRFLKQPRIKFEYGFLSDSTENVFKTKKENLK